MWIFDVLTQLRLCSPRGCQGCGRWGCLFGDILALGASEVSWDETSSGTLPCPAEAQPSCMNLVFSSHLRSGLRTANACENKEQKERKIFLWVSEKTAAGAVSPVVSLTEMTPSFGILDKAGADSLTTCSFYLCLSTAGCILPSRKLFVNLWDRARRHGKMAVKILEFQTQNQTAHIYLNPHTSTLANKTNENNNQAS